MREYDIYVPINYNDGVPIESFKLDMVKDDLLANFEGLSVSSEPVIGYWRNPDNRVYVHHDFNYVYKVIADDSEHVRGVITALKIRLEKALRQEKIFIVVRDVEVM